MGDIIHAMVALQYVKQRYYTLEIDWIVEESFADLLKGNPHIDNILTVNLKSIKQDTKQLLSQMRVLKAYAKNEYDLVIDAQGLIKSAFVAKLLGKKRAGFSFFSIREKAASLLYTQKVVIPYHANTIDRNAKVIAEPMGFQITSKMILEKEPFLYYDEDEVLEYLSSIKMNIVFIIGSTWKSRNYPKEKFVTIANEIGENVLIAWGSDQEREDAQWIASRSDAVKVLPKLDLNGLKTIIANADLVIGNDTGPTHMAWGFNIPSITLFGPTPVNRVYETPINKVLSSNSKVDHYKLNKEDFSIAEIDALEVVRMAKDLLLNA